MMTKRDNEIHKAAREHSDNRDNRMSFICGAQWADQHPKDNLVDIDKVCEWVQTNADKYVSIHVGYDESESYPYVSDDIVKDFKKAMKGE